MDFLRKYWLPVTIYLLAFFIIPHLLMGQIDDGFGLVIVSLVLINSIAIFFNVCYITYKYGLDWINLLIMAILYLLSCFIIWNNSAIGYLVFYGIIAGIALVVGYLFRRKIRSHI